MRLTIQTLAGALAMAGALQASAQPAPAPASAPAADPPPAVIVPGPETPADWDLVDKDPDRAAAALAGVAFFTACLMPLDTATSADAYAAIGSGAGAQLKARSPKLAALPMALDGVHGDTCQVTYQGAHIDLLWTAFGKYTVAPENAECAKAPGGPDRAAITCKASAGNPAYRLVVERTKTGITAAATWLGPKTP